MNAGGRDADAVPIRADIDGDLILLRDDGGQHHAKRLATDTFWHASLFDLPAAAEDVVVDAEHPLVSHVELNTPAGYYTIHYRAGLRVFDLASARQLAGAESLLGPWRVARIAASLVGQMIALHDAGVRQMVVHPERLACTDQWVALLPTSAGVLPALTRLPTGGSSCWMAYIAPEVLRTRGLDGTLLQAGDVYALGTLLAAIACPQWDPPLDADPLDYATRRVEALDPGVDVPIPSTLKRVAEIIDAMRRQMPEARISLKEALDRFEHLVQELDPEVQFDKMLRGKRLEQAQALLTEIDGIPKAGGFGVSPQRRLLMRADLELTRDPPQAQRAIAHLEQAERLGGQGWETQYRTAKAYEAYAEHPQHVDLCLDAIERAVGLSECRRDIVDHWLRLLQSNLAPDAVLRRTGKLIPVDEHPLPVVQARVCCWLGIGVPINAWYEAAHAFQRFLFDQQLYDLAVDAARRSRQGVDLIEWLEPYVDNMGYAAARAAVCQAMGADPETHLNAARRHQPSPEL